MTNSEKLTALQKTINLSISQSARMQLFNAIEQNRSVLSVPSDMISAGDILEMETEFTVTHRPEIGEIEIQLTNKKEVVHG